MTYGVDQCRMCGAPILLERREALAEYEEALRRPPMEEAQWRREGFLTVPTKHQLLHRAAGTCAVCAKKLIYQKFKPGARGIAWAVGFVAVFWVLTYIYIYARF